MPIFFTITPPGTPYSFAFFASKLTNSPPSFDNKELTGTYAALVSNRRDWTAHEIISLYLQRWPIETFYQDGKGHLGLDDYRMRTIEAIKKHWCLVFVAYSILHLNQTKRDWNRSTLRR